MAKALMTQYPIKYFRLYTNQRENKTALLLYEKQMDIREKYENEEDENYNGNCLIYSKSLIKEIIASEKEGEKNWQKEHS